jgi:hypothetical protein
MMRHLDLPPVWLATFICAVWLWQALGLPGSAPPVPRQELVEQCQRDKLVLRAICRWRR